METIRNSLLLQLSVFSIYVDGAGDTISHESLTDACTGVDRAECSICRAELGDIGYDFSTGKAFLYSKKYEKANAIKVP